MNPLINFRPAQVSEDSEAVALIYSSGVAAFDYVFRIGNYQACDFLNFAFVDGSGFFGWKNHTVATLNAEIVGIGAFYNGYDYLRLSVGLVWQVFRFYPLRFVPFVLWHSTQLQSLMPKPAYNMHYVANFAVRADKRGQGIGTALLNYQQNIAKQLGRKIYALDVALDNPKAQALYERLGFQAIRTQKFNGKTGSVPDTLRMEMCIH